MKAILLISLSCLALTACQSRPASNTVNASAGKVSVSQKDEAKIQCVANGGFLVPSGNDFACKLENGSVVGLSRFY